MDTTLLTQHQQQAKQEDRTVSVRNSLIELYRFLFALWVVWYHDFFIIKSYKIPYFDDGYLAVEFFFLLSGFYFTKTLNKYKDSPFWSGLLQILWKKIKPLCPAFLVGLVFVAWRAVLEKAPFQFGYLWYVFVMLPVLALIYALHRLIKRTSLFIITLVAIAVVCYLVLYIPIMEMLGVARGLGAITFGVLLGYIPKLELKAGRISFNAIITALIFAAVLFFAFLPKNSLMNEYLLVFSLMPMLIYFTSTLEVSSRALNFLGSLSFPIYSYQCVLHVLRIIYKLSPLKLFLILICLVAADLLIKTVYKHYKKKEAA